MRAKDWERSEARRLRAAGLSVGRIARQLGVAKSSVSVWVRDIPGPPRPPKRAKSLGRPTTPGAPLDPDEPLRYCSRGDHHVPESRFNRLGDGRQWWCRDCFKSYFREHREQSRAAKQHRKRAARSMLDAFLAEHPCVDCGEDDALVLEFDHLSDDKIAHIGAMLGTGTSVAQVEAEVAKCEVVCVNCHRRRTARRAGHFRSTGIFPPSWDAPRRRNNVHLIAVLRGSGCIDCGERDPVVFDFDHRAGKRMEVPRLALGCSLEVLQQEIEKCDVRCANCHRVRTIVTGGFPRGEGHWASGTYDE
jgi:transposase-like protein